MDFILERQQINNFVRVFYEQLLVHPKVSHFFQHLSGPENAAHLAEHLVTIADFWESNLTGSLVYKRDAMAPHTKLNKRLPMEKEHFRVWLALLEKAAEQELPDHYAKMCKQKARSIAGIMENKLRGL